jgi:hypothetical protein
MNKLTKVYEGNDIHWTYDGELSKQEAIEKQNDAGYPEAGYGFFHYKSMNGETTWNCQKSCD